MRIFGTKYKQKSAVRSPITKVQTGSKIAYSVFQTSFSFFFCPGAQIMCKFRKYYKLDF
jgi:hypothetical protein